VESGRWWWILGGVSEDRGPRVRELKIVLHYFFTGIVVHSVFDRSNVPYFNEIT